MKDRTDEEGLDPVADKPTDNASVRGELESRCGGKPEVSPAWDKTRGGRTRHNQERKENEAEPKGA